MKTLIVATDYSESADNALLYAAQMARQLGLNLVLYHAYNLPVPPTEGMVPPTYIQESLAEDQARLEELATQITNEYGVPAEAQCSVSPLIEHLGTLGSQYDESLVVMGMRSKSFGLKLFGSVTTSVLSEGKYPVLVVPAGAQYRGIAKILFACDYNSLSILHQLTYLRDLALKSKARIQILHIVEQPDMVMAGHHPEHRGGPKLEQVFRGVKHSYKEVALEDVIEGIEKGVQEFEADILTMVPHKAGFMDYLLNRSHTRKIAFRTHVPLLALPNRM